MNKEFEAALDELRCAPVVDIVTAIESVEYLISTRHDAACVDFYQSGMGVESADIWDYGHQES